MQNPKEVRSFRLDRNVIRMIQLSARRHGISENALVERVLARSLKIEPLAEVLDHVCLGKETFVSILEQADASGLDTVGAERGKKSFSLARELFESNGEEISFLRYISEFLGEQARWFSTEGALVRPERITLLHGYGLRWSGFLKAYLSSAYEIVSRDRLELKATPEYVSVRFPETMSK